MNNNKQLYFFALLLCSLSVFSQKDSIAAKPNNTSNTVRFELGTFVYGLTLRPGDFATRYKMVWDHQVFSGVYCKRYYNKNAIRSSIEYSRRSVYFGDRSYSRFSSNRGELASLELKIGYQRMLSNRRVAPYIFADAEYSYFRSLYYPTYYPYYSSYLIAPDYYYYQNYSLSGSFFSVSPGFGMRITLLPHIFVNAEASAQFFISKERGAYAYDTFSSIGINVKPLKLSIGYAF